MFGSFNPQLIVEASINVIKSTHNSIQSSVMANPGRAFEPIEIKQTKKILTTVDLTAERNAQHYFEKKLKDYNPLVLGEESLREETNLSGVDRLIILLDMVDGTDLLERGLSNWCSAIVFFYPPEQKIIASFVAIADSNIVYFAIADSDKVYKHDFRKKIDFNNLNSVGGPSKIETLDKAAIAFYGQKIKNLLAVSENEKFISYLKSIMSANENSEMRIYNLAGNPMMMKLFDNNKKIDAIFDICGQWPHDVVPGAYIAQKAGVVFTDLTGKPIEWGPILEQPASNKITYILASTENLSKELQNILN